MVFMPNRSTADDLFEQADQCFRRSRTVEPASRARGPGNAFMVKAVELHIKLQNLAKAATSPFPLRGRDHYGQAAF